MSPQDRRDTMPDPELEALFADDPDLYILSRRLRASRPDPVVGPHFQRYLRARLMDAAERELRPRGLRRLRVLRPRPTWLAGGGALAGAALIAAVLVTSLGSPGRDRVEYVQASASVAGNPRVDPNDVITISFNQSMDHTAVESGIAIHPATAYSTSWRGNDLVITPTHHLAANTPYTVTIQRQAVRSTSGTTAQSAVAITFGTKPTAPASPPPTPSGPPELAVHPVTPADPASALAWAPDGSLLVGAGATPDTSSPAASPAPSPTPSPTRMLGLLGRPTLSVQPTPGAPATPAPLQPAVVSVAPDGTLARFADTASAVSVAPGGRLVALLQPTTDGSRARVVVVDATGARRTVLATTDVPTSPLAWTGGDAHPAVVFVSGGRVETVDLQGTRHSVGGVRVAAGQLVLLSPDGRYAYLAPLPAAASPSPSPSASPAATNPDGSLVDLGSGATLTLPGARTAVAFSGDGSTVAWVDATGAAPVLDVAPTAGGSPSAVPTSAVAGDRLDSPSLSADASHVAYLLTHTGAVRLILAASPSGQVAATTDGTGMAAVVLAPAGDRVATVRRESDGSTVAVVATAPGGAANAPAPDAVPADASTLLGNLVDAQVGAASNPSALAALVAPGAPVDLVRLTPTGLSRGFVVSASRTPGADTVTARIRLVRDPSGGHLVAAFTDETVTVDRAAGGPYAVTAASVTPLQDETAGPQVVHVDTGRDHDSTVVRITFDSDLDPATVAGAVSVAGAHGQTVDQAKAVYDPDHRTIVVTMPPSATGALTVTVGTSLQDVSGQALAQAYQAAVQQ